MSTIRRQSVRSLAFLQADWIPMLTDCRPTSVSIALPRPAGRYDGVHKVSSNDWTSQRRPSDPMLIVFKVRTCQLPGEAEPSLSLREVCVLIVLRQLLTA